MRPSRITLNAGFRSNCRLLFFLLAILLGLGASATPASALQAGDLAVIGINLDASPQEVAIVALADIPSGTIIKITDKGWDSTSLSFFGQDTNEGTLTWTTGTFIPKGTVYKLAIAPGSPQGAATITPANAGSTVSVTGWTQYVFNLAGDQVFIYQGTESSPTFIYGFSNQYATNPAIIATPGQWQLDTFEPSVTNQSNLPGTLSNGTTALALTGNITNLHCDNNYYSGTQSATRDALLAAIGQTAGWSCNDTSIFDLNPGGTNFPNLFTVQSQPAYTATASAATATPAPGAANTITLTVKNSDGVADTTFSGTYNVTISGYAQAPNGSYGSFNGTVLTASPNTIGVNFNNGAASVSLALNKASAQTIGFGIAGVNTPATNVLVISPAAPAVNSIVRTTPSGSTTTSSVTYTATFTGPVTGMATSNFNLTTTGVSGASVSSVSGSGNTWTVGVNTGSGDGTVRLNLLNSTGLFDSFGNAVSNVPYNGGDVYTIDKTAPTVSIGAASASVTRGGPVSYTVSYAGADTITLAPADITLNRTGNANGTVGVTGTGNSTRTVTVSGITGDGTLGISIGPGTARDTAGNSAAASSASATFTVDNTAPTVSISSPTPAVTKAGPVTYTITYTGADAITLAPADITLNRTGNANGTVGVTGTGNSTRTVTVSGITGDGTLGISIGAGTASDAAGNSAAASSASATFTVDNTAPTLSISQPSASVTRGGPVIYTVSYTGADTITLAAADITLNRTGTANGTAAVSGTGNSTRTVTISGITGDGTLGISIGAGTASDTAGNSAAASAPSATVTVDNTAPTISISAPTPGVTKAGPVTYTIGYTGADIITLATADISLNRTGSANGTIVVSGTDNLTRAVTISGITGDGTLGISIGAGTASDAAGNSAAASSASATFTVDNTAPTVSIGAPSASVTKGGPVTYTITYTGADTITLAAADITLNRTGTATGTAAVSGTGNSTRTVTISGITGDGTLGISIGAGTASDTAGNSAAASAASATFTVDNTAPTVSIGAGTPALTKAGPVTYTVSYTGADTITLAAADITLNRTGTANGTVAVNGTGNTSRTVTISGITGDGTLGIGIGAGTASDSAGNSAAASAPSSTVTVDNTGPTVSIGAPTPSLTKAGPVTYTVTYMGADAITLSAADVTLNRTGTANGTVAVSGTGNSTRTVTVSGITGDGTLGIGIGAGTASDSVGNSATASAPSSTVTVDNTAPTVSIGAASAAQTRGGPVTYTVSYTGADTITLASANVILNRTGDANGTVSVSGTGNTTRTVTISEITGNGTLGISLESGTAVDAAGNSAAAAGPGTTFTVDNSMPYLTISAPSAAYTKSGPITFTLTYTGASGILLTADNITLNTTGTANGKISVTGRGPTTRTVTIYDITGDGTLGIRVAAGTAFDSAGHTAHAAGPSAVFAVENSAPGISISAPSALETKSCPITYTVTYSGGDTITLSARDIVLNKTGTATGTVTVSGNENNMRFVTISNISGDGTLEISIAAGTATDLVGNVAPAAGPSAYFIVDSELPAPCQDLAPILLLLSD